MDEKTVLSGTRVEVPIEWYTSPEQVEALVDALRPFVALANTWGKARSPFELVEGYYGSTTVELTVQHFNDAVVALAPYKEG